MGIGYAQFALARLSDPLKAKVQVVVGSYNSTHDFRIIADMTSLTPVAPQPQPGVIKDGTYSISFNVFKDVPMPNI